MPFMSFDMKHATEDRLTSITDVLENRSQKLPQDLQDQLHRLVQFTEYSLENEEDGNVAETFISVAERAILSHQA